MQKNWALSAPVQVQNPIDNSIRAKVAQTNLNEIETLPMLYNATKEVPKDTWYIKLGLQHSYVLE